MKRAVSRWLLLGVLCWASATVAQERTAAPAQTYSRGQGWSVLAAQTMGQGSTALVGQLGWPGLSFGVLHGAAPRFDIGGKLTFNYGEEGMVRRVVPGLKLQAWTRLMLVQTPRLGVGLSFAPGPLFYFRETYTKVGLALPLNLVVGIPVGSALMLNLGLDMPFYVIFGTDGGPVFPLLVGGGLEYFIDRSLAVTFNTRLGPTIFPRDRFRDREAEFTLEALFGIAWRL